MEMVWTGRLVVVTLIPDGSLTLFDEFREVGDFNEVDCPCTASLGETSIIGVKADFDDFKGFILWA